MARMEAKSMSTAMPWGRLGGAPEACLACSIGVETVHIHQTVTEHDQMAWDLKLA